MHRVSSQALFKGGAAADAIYRPTRTAEDEWGDEDAAAEKVMKAARFHPSPSPYY